MSRRARLTTTVLAAALLAGAALTPASAADDAEGWTVPDRATLQAQRETAQAVLEGMASGEAGADAAAQAAALVDVDVMRIPGADRYQVAAHRAGVFATIWDDPSWDGDRVAFVASGDVFPDSLSGGAFAGMIGGPILLVKKDRIPNSTISALQTLRPDWIVVIGGDGAVNGTVLGKLKPYAAQGVDRLGGLDRWGTSATIASGYGPSDRVYVATGQEFPDGLAGSAVAGSLFMPLVLTKKSDVPGVVMDAIAALEPLEIVVVGGETAVDGTAVAELATIAPVTRVGGKDRYAVARNLAAHLRAETGFIGYANVATGKAFPDALSAGPAAAMFSSPLLLTRPDQLSLDARAAIIEHQAQYVDVVGGYGALSLEVEETIAAMQVEDPQLGE